MLVRGNNMKIKFSLLKKEASMEADVEGIVAKSLEYKSKCPEKKTRYQIRQEEKRKNAELKHKQKMQYMYIMIGLFGVCFVVAIITSLFPG